MIIIIIDSLSITLFMDDADAVVVTVTGRSVDDGKQINELKNCRIEVMQ